MVIITKILKGKEVRKILKISRQLDDEDLQVIVELNEIENMVEEKNKNKLEKFFEKVDKLNIKIPENTDVDELINNMYDSNPQIIKKSNVIYFDTNILVYATVMQNEEKQNTSRKLIYNAIASDNFLISTLTLQEFVYALSRLHVPDEI